MNIGDTLYQVRNNKDNEITLVTRKIYKIIEQAQYTDFSGGESIYRYYDVNDNEISLNQCCRKNYLIELFCDFMNIENKFDKESDK